MGACTSGTSTVSSPPARSTTSTTTASETTTKTPVPSNFALSPGEHLVAHGVSTGIGWYFFTSADSSGTCREFHFVPPLSVLGTAGDGVNIGSNTVCFRPPVQIPRSTEFTGLPDYPLVVVDAEASTNHRFSVLAGQAAPGVTKVVAQFPDGSEITMRPSDADVFVAVSKPSKSRPPSAVIAYWPGGNETCAFQSDDTSYTCRRSVITGVTTVRNSRFGPVTVGCSRTGCDSSAAVFTRCSTSLHDYLAVKGGPTPDDVSGGALTTLLGKPPDGHAWTSWSCGHA